MINFNKYFYINEKKVGLGAKTYFIADIASNHDKSLNRAIELVNLAKEAGADAAKFQNFQAKSLVSDYLKLGFLNFLDSYYLIHLKTKSLNKN